MDDLDLLPQDNNGVEERDWGHQTIFSRARGVIAQFIHLLRKGGTTFEESSEEEHLPDSSGFLS